MLEWLGRLDPATLTAVCGIGWGLSREIRAVGERVTRLETEVRLLMAGHTMKGDNCVPASGVGPAPGTTGD